MAELILTEEEKALGMHEWSDEALGRAVKNCYANVFAPAPHHGGLAVLMVTAARILGMAAHDITADRLAFRIDNITRGDERIGDYEVVVQRARPTKDAERADGR